VAADRRFPGSLRTKQLIVLALTLPLAAMIVFAAVRLTPWR
jgi:hypothetical protein